jgi:5-methylcytosine-specific restriction endonuclease McrA
MKSKIPKALREQVWIHYNKTQYSAKCYINWCVNQIDVFNFHVGHNIAESKGGPTTIENLRPICSRCNLSMSNKYSIDEWNNLMNQENRATIKCCGLFQSRRIQKGTPPR